MYTFLRVGLREVLDTLSAAAGVFCRETYENAAESLARSIWRELPIVGLIERLLHLMIL